MNSRRTRSPSMVNRIKGARLRLRKLSTFQVYRFGKRFHRYQTRSTRTSSNERDPRAERVKGYQASSPPRIGFSSTPCAGGTGKIVLLSNTLDSPSFLFSFVFFSFRFTLSFSLLVFTALLPSEPRDRACLSRGKQEFSSRRVPRASIELDVPRLFPVPTSTVRAFPLR